MLVEVDDRLDDDLGVGVGAPGADLVGGDGAAVVLDPRQLQAVQPCAGDGGLGEVHVEHHLPRLGRGAVGLAGRCARVASSAVEVEGELAAGEVAGGDGAAYVEGLGRTRRP